MKKLSRLPQRKPHAQGKVGNMFERGTSEFLLVPFSLERTVSAPLLDDNSMDRKCPSSYTHTFILKKKWASLHREGDNVFYEHSLLLLEQRGVNIDEIADVVYKLQVPYHKDLQMETCVESVHAVLKKREVQHAIITGVSLDMLAEKKLLPEPFQTIMEVDEPLYGIDEILALSITNIYGTIGLTSFGYLDKNKVGIMKKLNNDGESIHVFLDDIVAGIAASASARIAHQHPDTDRYVTDRKLGKH